jgi:hypothetical protein
VSSLLLPCLFTFILTSITRKEVVLEINAEETKHKLISCDQTAGQSSNIKAVYKSLNIVTNSKYFRMMVRNKNYIYE